MPLLKNTIDVFQVQFIGNVLFNLIFIHIFLSKYYDGLRSYTKYITFRCHVFYNQGKCLIEEYVI